MVKAGTPKKGKETEGEKKLRELLKKADEENVGTEKIGSPARSKGAGQPDIEGASRPPTETAADKKKAERMAAKAERSDLAKDKMVKGQGLLKEVIFSQRLTAIVGKSRGTRSEAGKAMWAYCKAGGFLKEGDGRIIVPKDDPKLKALFGAKVEIHGFKDLPKVLTANIKKA